MKGELIMRIENKLTLSHLKENKRRTAVTVLGIIVSVAMITAVFAGVASYLDYYERSEISMFGEFHFSIRDITDEQIEMLENDSRIKSVGLQESGNGDNNGVKIIGGVNERLSTGYIHRVNDAFYEQMHWDNFTGAYPENENELIVRQEFIDKNNLDWKIGDTVTLRTGRRYTPGEIITLTITGEYQYGEEFDERAVQQFKITGILTGSCKAYEIGDFYSAFSNSGGLYAMVTLEKVNPFSVKAIKDITADLGITGKNYKRTVYLNDELLAAHFSAEADSSLMKKIIPMGLIVLLIIMAAAAALIYNAFGLSLSERTRYLGMLASVGATKQQKRRSVYFEGFILGIIGIPAGLLAGIGGIALTLRFLQDRLTAFLSPEYSSDITMHTVVPLWSVMAVVLFSTVTIFISSLIPAKKASAITPIDAIKQSNDVKVKAKRLKSPKLIRKIFGYEGELADKNLKRNGRKSRLITVSIALSAVLFLSVNYFCTVFTASNDISSDVPYQVEADLSCSKYYDEFVKELDKISSIDRYYSITYYFFTYGQESISNGELIEPTNQDITKQDNTTQKYSGVWDNVSIYVNAVEDEDFNALCEANGIDYRKYYQYENDRWDINRPVVVMNNISHKEEDDPVFTDKLIGEKIYNGNFVPDENIVTEDGEIGWKEIEIEDEWYTYEFGDFVAYDDDNYLCHLNGARTISAYLPVSMSFPYSSQMLYDEQESTMCLLGIETSDHKTAAEEIKNIFDNNEEFADGSCVIDVAENMQTVNNTVFVLQLFVYGFIALITLITVANIINTISTSIDTRRREFAMIKSVGAAPKGFKKMITLESMFYGVKSLVFAIPISIGISYLMNVLVADGKIPFELNILMYLAVIAAVFIIVGFSMLFSMSKIKNDNIVEALKEDIS